MHPFAQITTAAKSAIQYVLADIDDTLTYQGRLVGAAFMEMENLQRAGLKVIPITGRPAGWCDHIARMWPVEALVGENGAFYFHYDRMRQTMVRRYFKSAAEREKDRLALNRIQAAVLNRVPGAAVSSDQPFRLADLAIDFCEDVPALPKDQVEEIVRCFHEAGAQAKISSIHVNGWFGRYDKLSMTRMLFRELFQIDLEAVNPTVLFIGDSPNDAPMFAFFEHSVGVANVRNYIDRIATPPAGSPKKKADWALPKWRVSCCLDPGAILNKRGDAVFTCNSTVTSKHLLAGIDLKTLTWGERTLLAQFAIRTGQPYSGTPPPLRTDRLPGQRSAPVAHWFGNPYRRSGRQLVHSGRYAVMQPWRFCLAWRSRCFRRCEPIIFLINRPGEKLERHLRIHKPVSRAGGRHHMPFITSAARPDYGARKRRRCLHGHRRWCTNVRTLRSCS
jgi:HAD superfamily hydrolase (TIGR01484 family)